jgi:putative metallohydrolase (TIGR04338 family)
LAAKEFVAEQQLSRQRDSQRSKVYKSDRSLDGISKPLPSVEDIEAYVAKTFASKQVRKAFKRCYWSLPEAIDGRSLKWAWADKSVVFMPKWARREGILLHELAHTITRREYGPNVEGHGWQFCATYLKLVLFMMGREAHDLLKTAMISNRVKFHPPRKKRLMSPEQKDARPRLYR